MVAVALAVTSGLFYCKSLRILETFSTAVEAETSSKLFLTGGENKTKGNPC